MENIEELAMEDMTERGIHHDDFPDHEHEYIAEIIANIARNYQIEELTL